MISIDTQVKSAIADRAVDLFKRHGVTVSKLEMLMDIDNVNDVCPLQLRGLLEASPLDFSHDIFGIYQYFNRQSKQLEDCFIPRYAA